MIIIIIKIIHYYYYSLLFITGIIKDQKSLIQFSAILKLLMAILLLKFTTVQYLEIIIWKTNK